MGCSNVTEKQVLLLLAYALLEFWLGKTKAVRANSVVELIAVLSALLVALLATVGRILWKPSKNKLES